MARRKKSSNELDAILEQLKRSYGADSDAELEDSLLEDEESEEDAELSSILASIFSDLEEDGGDAEERSQDTLDDTVPEDAVVDKATEEIPQEVIAEAQHEKDDADVTIEQISEAQPENIQEQPEALLEANEVDSVLDAMLGLANGDIDTAKDLGSPIAEILDESPAATTEGIEECEIEEIAPDTEPIIIEASLEDEEEIVKEEETVEIEEAYEAEEVIEEEEALKVEDKISDADEYEQKTEEIQEPVTPPHIVLNECDYTSDPLQLDFSDLQFIKPDEDVYRVEVSVLAKEDTTIYSDEAESVMGEGDSLLLKFGYGDDINKDKSNKEKDIDKESLSHDKNTIIYGYCGKEYSNKDQADEIRKKYKSDRFMLFVTLIALCSFTLISFIVGLIFEFAPQKLDYYVPAMSLDFLLVSLAALICGKRIIMGASAISKFEVNSYSVMLIIGAEYLLYNVVISAIYIINPVLLHSSFSWISGSCVLAYFAVVILCDLITCHKEYKTFELIADSEELYCAQKIYPSMEDDSINALVSASSSNAYRVKRTFAIKGYFKKTSGATVKALSPIYVLGIVPFISLALSCGAAIISESAVRGIHTFMIASVLCIPFSCLCLESVNGFIGALKRIKNNAAFIGTDSELEYSAVSLLVFEDTEAIEITSYKEINSAKGVDGIQSKLTMAYNVFNTLGGPLGEVVPDKYASAEGHELIINSISDNGIDVYFDSSTNILIGDRQYMQAHNLKVKTDVNLTTATKGATVIYMAFDGKPQLGFVLTGRILPDFSKLLPLLSSNRIAVSVESYEPEVNDLYFEQNKSSDFSMLSVHKPIRFLARNKDVACDTNLVAKDALSISYAITECKNEPRRKKSIKKSNLISFIIGMALAAAIAATLCIDAYYDFLSILGQHPFITVSIASVLSAIPAIINAAKEYFRK